MMMKKEHFRMQQSYVNRTEISFHPKNAPKMLAEWLQEDIYMSREDVEFYSGVQLSLSFCFGASCSVYCIIFYFLFPQFRLLFIFLTLESQMR